MALGLFPGCGCLATNVVERFFAIGAKLGVLEFPCLSVVNTRPTRIFFFSRQCTYVLPIWRLAIFFIILSHLVEIVFVQLSDETSEVAVFEVFG